MRSALRIAAAAVLSVALGCGPPLPPPMATIEPSPARSEPVAADPDEEIVAPEIAPFAPEDETPVADAGASAELESAEALPAAEPPDATENIDRKLLATLDAAEAKASDAGRLVLATGRKMALVDRVVILGACWDYANTVYKRAGFPANKRKTVFNRQKTGPYADPELFQPGDFLSYSHDAKGNWVHSAIFVDWKSAAGRVALMLSYVGGRKPIPAIYARNELSRVFRIVRPKP